MTNEQLYIIITLWRKQLEDEIKNLRQVLPPNMERRVNLSSHQAFELNSQNDFVALDGLKRLSRDLGHYQDVLHQENVSRPTITRRVGGGIEK